MENLQTLNDFPVLDLWVNPDGSPLINVKSSFVFQGKLINASQQSLMHYYVKFLFEPFLQKINIKKLGVDNIDHSNINVVIAICVDMDCALDALENITQSLYDWCDSNNIKILISMPLETIADYKVMDFDLAIKDDLINNGFKSSTVKILNNAYDVPPNMIYSEFVIPIDTMRRPLRHVIKNTINDIGNVSLSADRQHNFSLLTGTLRERWPRVLFLSKCHDLNLLDDKFFYSICMIDEANDLLDIQKEALLSDDKGIILEACKTIFKHKTYDAHGNLLIGETIYDNNTEYFTPPQVLDSYVNVVLETVDFSPSISEKIYKPLAMGLPFVWYGYPNILQYLESLGFKRYDYIDYSFDINESPQLRLDLLIAEIQRLSTLDLKTLTQASADISKHNQRVFDSISKDYNDLWKHLK